MQRVWKVSEYFMCRASRTWRAAFRDVFCCHPGFDSHVVPRNEYAPYAEKTDKDAYYEERAPLTPSHSRSSEVSSSGNRGSNRREEIRADSPISKGPSINEIGSLLSHSSDQDEDEYCVLLGSEDRSPVTKQPVGNKEYGACDAPATPPARVLTPRLSCDKAKAYLSLSAPAGLNELPSRSPSPVIGQDIESCEITPLKVESVDNASPNDAISRVEPEGSSDISEEDVMKLVGLVERCVEPVKPIYIQTVDHFLNILDACNTPLEVLESITYYIGVLSPSIAVACVHHIYAKTSMLYERNSEEYNQMCGEINKNKEFRRLMSILEQNAESLPNFALLTSASDLLLLRLTLRKKTIPILLAAVDVEKLDLEELGVLASCLHTPNIPLVNSEYFYNVSASVAMRELKNIDDLYKLMNIMKCFGRYFTIESKRECEGKVKSLCHELCEQGPDGRSKAAHMFDAFYRMEYAPNRAILKSASEVICQSAIPIQPQDISAVFRYCVKYGYGSQDKELLDCLSGELQKSIDVSKASQLTTNVKWLTVFYYYDEYFMQKFVECVRRDMQELDFVALSDVLDALAQVYFVPENSDNFFDRLYAEMINKLPTLMTSHVHNANRKLLLTAFHFAVYGRYPEQLIQLALSENQLSMHMGNGGTRHFLVDLCRSLSVERPDLLPKCLPMNIFHNSRRPKLYAFEKDVQGVLLSICSGDFFQLMLSTVCFFPFFLLQMRLDGTLLPVSQPGFIPPHRHQMVQNVAVVPLPRSRFCFGSKHAIGKTRLVLRLLRAQGARVVTVPHYDWDNNSNAHKVELLRRKIFKQKIDDTVE